MTEDEIREAVKTATREAIDEALGPLYVEREIHWRHHQWIEGMMTWAESTKSTVWGVVVRTVVYGVLALLAAGAVLWGREHLK